MLLLTLIFSLFFAVNYGNYCSHNRIYEPPLVDLRHINPKEITLAVRTFNKSRKISFYMAL